MGLHYSDLECFKQKSLNVFSCRPSPLRQMLHCIFIPSLSISHMTHAATEAQAGKRTLHIRPFLQPAEQQMNESAVKASECLALCGGSAIITSAAIYQRGGGGE